jgi:hypothetical protein
MKYSLHGLIPLSPLFSITFDCRLSQFSAATANTGTRLNSSSSCVRSSLYSLGADPQKTPLPLLSRVDSLLQGMFTAQLRSNERGADPQRTPLSTPLLLLRDVTAYMTRSSAACVRASNGCFSASTVLALSKYATIYFKGMENRNKNGISFTDCHLRH